MSRWLLNALRAGGLIIYARHGEATVGIDSPYINFRNCSTQRNLSDEGRRQAIYYGEILRYLQIPIEYPVSTSPFCRTIETALLAFGNEKIQVNPLWSEVSRLNGNLTNSDRQRILYNINSFFEKVPEEGRNKVIIAHNFPTGVGLGQIPNMGTVIIKPRGTGNGYDVVSHLSLADWSTLHS